jgi:hypothetical protein
MAMSVKEKLQQLIAAMSEEEASRFFPVVQHAVEAEMSPAGIAYRLGTLEGAVAALKDQVESLHVDVARSEQRLEFIKSDLGRLEHRIEAPRR